MEESPPKARLIITAPGEAAPELGSELHRIFPGVDVRGTDFYGVFDVRAEGDSLELARTLIQESTEAIGRVVAVFAEVESRPEEIRDAAVEVAVDRIEPGESFAFRLHKRGAHYLRRDTPEIEREIGDALGEALTEKHGQEPTVDLDNPDVTVQAELLGPLTAVGISKSEWRRAT